MKKKASALVASATATAEEQRRRQAIVAEIFAREKQPRPNTMKLVLWDSTLAFARGLKRFIDIMGSLAALVVLSPLLLVVAMLIKLEDGGSIIYRRCGWARTVATSSFTNSVRCMRMPTGSKPP